MTVLVPLDYYDMLVVPDLFGPGKAEDFHIFYLILIHPAIKNIKIIIHFFVTLL